jgi:hypothetical protein
MEKIKLAIVVMVLAVVTGCASDPTKHSYAMNVMKSLEFDEGLRDQEIPPGEYAKLKEVRVTRPGDSIETATSTAALAGAAGVAYMAGGLSWGTFGSGGIALTSIIDLLDVKVIPASSSFVAFIGEKSKYATEDEFKNAHIPLMRSLLQAALNDAGYQATYTQLPDMSWDEKKQYSAYPTKKQNGYDAFQVSKTGLCQGCYVMSMGLLPADASGTGHAFGKPVFDAKFPVNPDAVASKAPVYVAIATPYPVYFKSDSKASEAEFRKEFKAEILAALASRAPSNMLIYIAPQTYPNQPAPYIIYQNKIHFFAKEVAPK